jgi:hypothetical protein
MLAHRPRPPDAPPLLQLAERLEPTPDELGQLRRLSFGRHGIARWPLLATAHRAAWLVRWAPGGRLPLHDHGGARGLVRVLEGAVVERALRRLDAGGPRWIRHALARGTTRLFPSGVVHELACTQAHEALTLHVFVNGLDGGVRYAVEADELVVTGPSPWLEAREP